MAELAAQQKLLKCRAYLEGNPSDVKLLYIFNKLLRFPVTVEILRDTGIGKVVNSFRKREGEIGEKARAVVTQWKAIVSQQDDDPVEKAEPDSPSALQPEPHALKSKSLSEGEKREKSLASRTIIDSPHSKNISKSSSSSSSSSDREHHDKISRTEREKSSSVSSSTSKTDNSYHKSHSSSSSSSSSKQRHNNSSGDIVNKHSSSSNSSKSSKDKNLSKDDKNRDKKSSKKDKKSSNPVKTDGGLSFEDFMNYDDSAVIKKFQKSKNSSSSPSSSSSSSSKKKNKESLKEVSKVKTEVAGSSSRSSSAVSGSLKRSAAALSSDVKTSIHVPSPPKKLSLSENDILSSLPEIQTHYHPWRLRDVNKGDAKSGDKKDDLDAVLAGIKSRTRECVYSGKRTVITEVPTLFNACIQILIENIDNLEYVGGIPFDILQPVLERCSASQLYTLEDYNPHLLEDSDKLWKIHCQRDFRGKEPDEMEAWRELYLRLLDEREARLKAVRANITASMSKAAPERTVKMAFVEAPAKPPRDVRRRQLKFGTGTITKEALGPYRTYKPVNNSSSSASSSTPSSAPSSAPSRPSVSSLGSGRIQVSQQHRSTKVVAPMMMKTMKMMKRMQRR